MIDGTAHRVARRHASVAAPSLGALTSTLEATAEPDWAQLALAAGYHDQPHMAREFRELAGLSPTRYRQARARHRDHVPRGVHPFHTVCGVGDRARLP